jgi:spore coat protein H
MIKISNYLLGVIGVFLLFVALNSLAIQTGQVQEIQVEITPTPTPTLLSAPDFAPINDINNFPFQDNKSLYENDDPSSIVTIYITVRKGNALENTDYTWQEVNSFDKWINGSRSADDVVGQAEVIVQFGDENGPLPGELGYDSVVPNGTIQIRGASSSSGSNPKSYKIELYDDAGTWRGQSTIAINKHYYDPIRIRNKLSFDLLKDIPHMITLRTQFVHLFVKDETINPVSTRFVDYGLFTQIEQINKTFLRNHLLDPNAHLYKATSFEFFRYADQIRLENDPLFNVGEFQDRLEIKGNRDHTKLIQMLDDVNNYEIPITQTFEKYFDAENYFTWLAFNILVGNIDTQNQNYYLYSPYNSEKWYFIPWDYDGSLGRQSQAEVGVVEYLGWEVGLNNYWGGVIHNRVLREEKYRLMLDAKINELNTLMPPEKIVSMMKIYQDVTEPYLSRLPDVKYARISRAQYNLSISLIPSEIENNRKLYFEAQKLPMPFFLGTPQISGEAIKFNWGAAYNFDPQNITYRFIVSKDIAFSNIVFEDEIVNITNLETPIFDPGEYYWRVIATNEDGKSQYPFDAFFPLDGSGALRYGGMKYFLITPEGTLSEAQ